MASDIFYSTIPVPILCKSLEFRPDNLDPLLVSYLFLSSENNTNNLLDCYDDYFLEVIFFQFLNSELILTDDFNVRPDMDDISLFHHFIFH